MSKDILRLLDYWAWYKDKEDSPTIEGFLDYLSDQRKKGGGL